MKRLLALQFWGLLAAVAFVSLRSLPEGVSLPASDKLLHLVAYAGTVLSARVAYPHFPPAIMLGLGLFLFSIAIEFGQLLVPGRSGDILDGLANGMGIVTGLSLWRLATLLRQPAAGS